MPGLTHPKTETPFKPRRREQLEFILENEVNRDLIMEILIEKYTELIYGSHEKKDLAVIPPDGLRIVDKDYFGIPTKPWRALEYLCLSHNYTASMGNLAERVWEDQTIIATFGMRNDLRSRLNDFFRCKNITTYHVEGIGGYLCIRPGPPRPKKSLHDSHGIPTRAGILDRNGGQRSKNHNPPTDGLTVR